jgi:ubiquinone/menaquinone biosynthesis C-methylase UbiE
MQGDRIRDAEPGYRLAATGRQQAEDERLGLLEQLFDPASRRQRGFVRPGWRCLDVGAGRGSIAIWLAEQVGPTGHVVATDIDLTYLQRLNLPNLEVRRHNILEDPLETLKAGSFDLVSSRLLLFWLAGKQETAIRRMTELLRPGGWLVDEDGDWGSVGPVDSAHPLYEPYHDAYREWWASRGYDSTFGRRLPLLFERCGLENIRQETSAEVVRGGSPWARWWEQTLDGIESCEQAAGTLTKSREQEYQALRAPFADSSCWSLSELLHGCRGQRLP